MDAIGESKFKNGVSKDYVDHYNPTHLSIKSNGSQSGIVKNAAAKELPPTQDHSATIKQSGKHWVPALPTANHQTAGRNATATVSCRLV